METQGMLNNPSHPGEEEQGWGYHAPWFQKYYRAVGIKPVWQWHKNRHTDQRNRLESKPMNMWLMNLWQRSQEFMKGKDSLLWMVLGKFDSYIQKTETRVPSYTKHTKINPKFEDLKPQNSKKETWVARPFTWVALQTKKLLHSKADHHKMNMRPTEWEEVLGNHPSDKPIRRLLKTLKIGLSSDPAVPLASI